MSSERRLIRMPARLVALLVAVVTAGYTPTASAAVGCMAGQLKLSSKACKALAKCQSNALQAGTPVDAFCVSAAHAKLSEKLATLEAKGGCTVVDAASGVVSGLLAAGASDIAAALAPDGSYCAAKKMQATGKLCASHLKCESAAAAAATNTDSACLDLASSRFDGAFDKADATGNCSTMIGADAIGGQALTLIDDVADYLAGRDCDVASDCAGIDTECAQRTCTDGHCSVSNAASGTPLASQTAGDCQTLVCDGSGGTMLMADDADGESDGNACTSDGCEDGVPTHAPLPEGSECDPEGKYTCDGAGACLLCDPSIWCTDPLAECNHWVCHGDCYVEFDAYGEPANDPYPGDCQSPICNGMGETTYIPDPSDGTCPP